MSKGKIVAFSVGFTTLVGVKLRWTFTFERLQHVGWSRELLDLGLNFWVFPNKTWIYGHEADQTDQTERSIDFRFLTSIRIRVICWWNITLIHICCFVLKLWFFRSGNKIRGSIAHWNQNPKKYLILNRNWDKWSSMWIQVWDSVIGERNHSHSVLKLALKRWRLYQYWWRLWWQKSWCHKMVVDIHAITFPIVRQERKTQRLCHQ